MSLCADVGELVCRWAGICGHGPELPYMGGHGAGGGRWVAALPSGMGDPAWADGAKVILSTRVGRLAVDWFATLVYSCG